MESVQELSRHPENTCYDDLFDDIENPSDSDDVDVDTISVHSTPKPKLTYVLTRDVYPAIFSNPVPAKTVPGTGYLSRIVLGPFWQLVGLSSPSEWVPYCKTVGLDDSLVVSHVDQLFYIY